MVSTPSELAALLQSQVSAGEAAPPMWGSTDAAPAAIADPGEVSLPVGPAVTQFLQEEKGVWTPELALTGTAYQEEPGVPEEELLMDKLLDKLEDRLRQESIRCFGLGGGDL